MLMSLNTGLFRKEVPLNKSRAPSSKKMEDFSSGAELDEDKEEAAPAIPEATIEEKGPYLGHISFR
jgi:hypothetical protein